MPSKKYGAVLHVGQQQEHSRSHSNSYDTETAATRTPTEIVHGTIKMMNHTMEYTGGGEVKVTENENENEKAGKIGSYSACRDELQHFFQSLRR